MDYYAIANFGGSSGAQEKLEKLVARKDTFGVIFHYKVLHGGRLEKLEKLVACKDPFGVIFHYKVLHGGRLEKLVAD